MTRRKPVAATDECERCGLPHPRCQGHNRAGKPCGSPPLPDMRVCRLHGGKSPNAQQAAKERAIERAALEAVRRQRWADGDETPVDDAPAELARLAGEAVAFKDYLRDQVTDLNGLLTYWQEKDYYDSDGDVEWTKAAEDVRAVVAAYERAQTRCARMLADIVKLDLAGRMLELNTAKAALVVEAVRAGLANVDMPAELRRGAQDAIAEALAGMSRTPTLAAPKELTA